MLLFSDFNKTWIFSTVFFSKNSQTSNFMKIRPVGAELLHADGQTDMTYLTVAYRNFAKAYKKGELMKRQFSPTKWEVSWSCLARPTRRSTLPSLCKACLLGIGQIRMRSISSQTKLSCYPSRKRKHRTGDHYTPLEMPDIFSLCVVLKQSVADSNSSPLPTPTAIRFPHHTRYTLLSPRGNFVVYGPYLTASVV